MKRLLLLLCLILSGPVLANQWLCVPNQKIVGFSYQADTASWEPTLWEREERDKYLLRKRKNDDLCIDGYDQLDGREWWALFRFGGSCMLSCWDNGRFEKYGLLWCVDGEDTFLFSKDTQRYTLNISSSYYKSGPRGDAPDTEAGSAMFEIGLCSKF